MNDFLSLNEIYQKNLDPSGLSGDKGTDHTYISEYEKILAPYRYNSTILEIGIFTGYSIKTWNEYFHNSTIIGVDNISREIIPIPSENGNQYEIIITDARFDTFLNLIKNHMFDIIIDDGTHSLQDQVMSFNLLKNKMKKNGIYIIEDIQNLDKDKDIFMSLHENINIIDNRKIKNRWDDILIIYKF